MDSGVGKHAIEVANADGTGDLIYMDGAWSGVGGDGTSYGGKLANVYARQNDGSWKTVLHIWN